ncbi:MAG TPA: class I SAM-dependent methyltransferase [Blastocatellia bacterium]|nr:class I SAM-dependent methyltransferase [Blastocatellia bacterium]
MSSQAETQLPSPIHFFETINAHQRTSALKAAIELDIFTAIGEGVDTARALADRAQASERGVRILCDFLVVIDFLTKSEGRYGLTPDSAAFLDRRSPACLASTAKFLTSPTLMEAFKDLTTVVKEGTTLIGEEGTMEPEHPVWVEFARAMAPMIALPAELIAQRLDAAAGERWKVLDIAAGHGLFGITIARHNPNAQIVAVDWANVLEVAKENAEAAGVADRHTTIAGSAFDVDYGEGYDLALITNFLHHFDQATCEKLLRKVHAALKPGGRAVTLDFVPNEDRVTPPPAASFAMTMLGTTAAGDAYTLAEYERIFSNAGFSSTEMHELPPTIEQLLISRK